MLKMRMITAFILATVVFSVLFFAPPSVVQATMMLFLGICMAEWTRFYSKSKSLLVLTVVFVESLYASLMMFSAHISPEAISLVTASLWALSACSLWKFNPYKSVLMRPVVFLGLGVLLLPLSFYHLHHIWLTALGAKGLVALILMVASADVGAYFVGRFCGKNRLAPLISPNKTQEGVVGGLVLASLVGGSLAVFGLTLPFWIGAMLGFIIAIVSVVGDLFESGLKRLYNIKDSGTLLPGHGGFLDRLDSILPASVVYYIFITHVVG